MRAGTCFCPLCFYAPMVGNGIACEPSTQPHNAADMSATINVIYVPPWCSFWILHVLVKPVFFQNDHTSWRVNCPPLGDAFRRDPFLIIVSSFFCFVQKSCDAIRISVVREGEGGGWSASPLLYRGVISCPSVYLDRDRLYIGVHSTIVDNMRLWYWCWIQ